MCFKVLVSSGARRGAGGVHLHSLDIKAIKAGIQRNLTRCPITTVPAMANKGVSWCCMLLVVAVWSVERQAYSKVVRFVTTMFLPWTSKVRSKCSGMNTTGGKEAGEKTYLGFFSSLLGAVVAAVAAAEAMVDWLGGWKRGLEGRGEADWRYDLRCWRQRCQIVKLGGLSCCVVFVHVKRSNRDLCHFQFVPCSLVAVWIDPMASSIVARQLAAGGGGPDVVSEEIVFILTVAGVLVIQYVPFDMFVHRCCQRWHVPLTLWLLDACGCG